MPVRMIRSRGDSSNPASRIEKDFDDHTSMFSESTNRSAKLYDKFSEDNISDCGPVFVEEANRLEREYFESLHVE